MLSRSETAGNARNSIVFFCSNYGIMLHMPSKRCAFRHNDAARLIRATKAALPGCKVKGVRHEGNGVVTVLVEEAVADPRAESNDWAGVLKNAPDEKRTP
jgi:hypothetical protein